jgi:hypothetical protein
LERALFDRGAAVILLETVPSKLHLQQLLANGMLVLAPPLPIAELENIDWIETNETAAIRESVLETLSRLEDRPAEIPRHLSTR